MKTSHRPAPTQQFPSQPSLFSVSIFHSPQQFLALYLAIQSPELQVQSLAAHHLLTLLHRTKSPPIALTYTKEFLLLRSESQTQLAIIRFISQLSDLSTGKSMQSSLSFIIDNSSFLTELRHNLTHRVMVKGLVIERGRQMILHELKDKYWKVMFDKIFQLYSIDHEQVLKFFERIVRNECSESQKKNNSMRGQNIDEGIKKSNLYKEYSDKIYEQGQTKLTPEYLFSNCSSNYQFKSLIRQYLTQKLLPNLLIKLSTKEQEEEFTVIYELKEEHLEEESLNLSNLCNLPHLRSVILMHTVLDLLLIIHKYKPKNQCSKYRQLLSQLAVILIQLLFKNQQKNNQNKNKSVKQLLLNPLIIKKLRQIYLLKSIQQFHQVILALPQHLTQTLHQFWTHKQATLPTRTNFTD